MMTCTQTLDAAVKVPDPKLTNFEEPGYLTNWKFPVDWMWIPYPVPVLRL
jgi:hypothetical protein